MGPIVSGHWEGVERGPHMTEYSDCYWQSRDGLRLHYRDYPGREDRPPVICIPGLTRNARDFEGLVERLAGEWRVLCPELRGRGDSAYARESASYNPMQYAEDLTALLEATGIARFVAFGTSLGGLLTMLLAYMGPQRIAAALLNDIGPDIEEAGLSRIKGYVGQGRSFSTWMHAARAIEESQRIAYPDYRIGDWLAMAKRLMVLSDNGRIVFDYDMKIAQPFFDGGAAPDADLWPALDALAGRPVLFIRGELSDVLSAKTLEAMLQRVPGADAVTVARTGHAPKLDEPQVLAAIDRLLGKVT
jgi:pimeloyl-ACP methyl ester carboxylesterase